MAYEVVIVRSNAIIFDPRVRKISKSLAKKYNVLVLGWNRESLPTSFFKMEKNILVKLLRLKAPYGKIGLVAFYPIFWLWITFNLFAYRPKYVHACDLDGMIPCYFYRIIFRRTLIFDSFDRYAMAFIPTKFHTLYMFVNNLENIFAKNANVLIVVSPERLSTFQNYKPLITQIIMNCSDDEYYKKSDSQSTSRSEFNLVYAGIVTAERGLLFLINAINAIPRAKLLLAGRIYDKHIKNLWKNPKINYSGILSPSRALCLEAEADVIAILYDPIIPINMVANPNKLFEAMMLGKPVISNVCHDIITEENCGIIVNYDRSDILKGLLLLYENPSLRKKLGENGRKAFERKYNWSIMENRLFEIYNKL
jgi:glycosyltransferase involved in cell wall biosynthesis